MAFSEFTVSAAGVDEVITSADIYLPAMLAMGVFISGTQNLGIDIAIEKHDGPYEDWPAPPFLQCLTS